MESIGPILGNPLLLAAIILFLALLPRALRQGKKTALERAVERFENEESKTAVKEKGKESGVEDSGQKEPSPLEDSPAREMAGKGGIPAFPEAEPSAPVQEEKVKIVKEGISISHNEAAEASPAPKKKVKVAKESVPISHNEDKIISQGEPAKSPHLESSTTPDKQKKASWDEDFNMTANSDSKDQDSGDSWIEAEIPGLIMDPPPEEKISKDKPRIEISKDILTFEASPKTKGTSGMEVPRISPMDAAKGRKLKIEPISLGKKEAKRKKPAKIKPKTAEPKQEISDSEPKAVEIKAVVVSHKDIDEKQVEKEKAEPASSKAEEIKTIEPEISVEEVSTQKEDRKDSSAQAKPKPFFLDTQYLVEDEEAVEEPVSPESSHKLSPEMVEQIVARLNDLQVNLENQFVSMPGKPGPGKSQTNEATRKDRIGESPVAIEQRYKELAEKKVVSLEELDSFLFTGNRKK